MRRRVRER
jgi:hypothetical protein